MIAIIDYGAGNIRSVQNALRSLGKEPLLTSNSALIKKADQVILPGVGAAGFAMQQLEKLDLIKLIPALTQPVLGICLGQQLMCKHSEEGNTNCLNLFDLDVKKFPGNQPVPHMGWNAVHNLRGPIWKDIPEGTDFYFVHSFYVETSSSTTGITNYQVEFSAAIERDNFFAVQFHPEKSGEAGQQLLKNFLAI